MKTIASMFRAFAFVCRGVYGSVQKPFSMKVARINVWCWCAVSACAAIALLMDYLVASRDAGWWSWWYLWNGPVFGLDLLMLRASVIGWAYRKTQDAEDAAFVDIIVHGYSKQP